MPNEEVVRLLARVERRINVCALAWQQFGHVLSTAYDDAYETQKDLLERVKEAIKAQQEREYAMMVFTLSILTVGIVGAVAKTFVGRVVPEIGKGEAEAFFSAVAKDWFKDQAGDAVKKGAEKFQESMLEKAGLSGGPAKDGFSPVGMTPNRYGHVVAANILQTAKVLAASTAVISDLAETLPLESAQTFHDTMMKDEFLTTPPDVDASRLAQSAELALWIAWARNRDKDYWYRQQLFGGGEGWQFAPVRTHLIKDLQVPANRVTVPNSNFKVSGAFYRSGSEPLNVYEFIGWAKSPAAMELAFRGLPQNREGRALAETMAAPHSPQLR